MLKSSTFQVYNASAGSGKTYTLVKEYLKVLLSSEELFTFQKVLAITFTNKAAGEMKERVLENLKTFSEGQENDMLLAIMGETDIDKSTLAIRSKRILEAILQNYAAFSITTIDSFTHKIIKNFAFDLGLSINFEVELDANSLLNEAVDILISKIGTDKDLTSLLINYSLDKIDEDKSWDIANDLNEFAKVLLSEDDIPHFKKIAANSLQDFIELKGKLQSNLKIIESEFNELADKVLNFIKDNNLNHTDFSYGDYPKHFLKFKNLKNLKFDAIKFEGRLFNNIKEGKKLYAKKTPPLSQEIIDDFIAQFEAFYAESESLFKSKFPTYLLSKIVLKSIVPLAVLNKVNAELEFLKEENNIQLNAEFNQLISENIKDQPAPYIYERIGQRFQHYFIDEMQDTSVLQWQNLIPLVNNALSQENANLLLVGDAKQAIYRWRGGKAEQFIGLGLKQQPIFPIEKEIKNLETNYRSYSEIINFNNAFFQHVSAFFQNESYKNIYVEGNKQNENHKKGGFVSINFLEETKDSEEKKEQYPKKVFEKINEIKENFSLDEICVLVRTRKDGVAVASYLSERGVDIVSSETLLLKNNVKVNFLIDFLTCIQNPSDEETRFDLLYFLYDHLKIVENRHHFLNKFIKLPLKEFFSYLELQGYSFDLSAFLQIPIYEKVETIIRSFNLVNSSDAYIQFFLDIVLEQHLKSSELGDFLDFWDRKQDSLSIVAPKTSNAVQIMTIHKSKGLEFPVVIFPCDLEIYRQIKPKIWFDDLSKNFQKFDEFYIDYSKSLTVINQRGLEIYDKQREELELDNFNLLYVALTRSVEQLYIITDQKFNKGVENTNFYSGIFINFLNAQNLFQKNVLEYTFGNKTRNSKKEEETFLPETHQKFISTPLDSHQVVLLASSSKLWDTNQGEAIEYGNLFHEILSKIYTLNDVEKVISNYTKQGFIKRDQKEEFTNTINEIVSHPILKPYYSKNVQSYNEREIIDFDNQIIIPDKLVYTTNKNVVIIDYKTGAQSNSHKQQLLKYSKVLESMQLKVDYKYLVYIHNKIDIIEV